MANKLTSRDIEIVKHIDTYGFLTFSQAYKIWFSKCNYGYDVARRRLKAICDLGYIKMHKTKLDTFFFIDETYYSPSEHMILTMDVYASLIMLGCEILYYKREQPWVDGARRSDAYAIFNFDHNTYSLCIEVLQGTAINNAPSSFNNSLNVKYKQIIASKEPHELFKKVTGFADADNVEPSILIVDVRLDFIKDEWDLPNFTTYAVNESLDKIAKVLI